MATPRVFLSLLAADSSWYYEHWLVEREAMVSVSQIASRTFVKYNIGT